MRYSSVFSSPKTTCRNRGGAHHQASKPRCMVPARARRSSRRAPCIAAERASQPPNAAASPRLRTRPSTALAARRTCALYCRAPRAANSACRPHALTAVGNDRRDVTELTSRVSSLHALPARARVSALRNGRVAIAQWWKAGSAPGAAGAARPGGAVAWPGAVRSGSRPRAAASRPAPPARGCAAWPATIAAILHIKQASDASPSDVLPFDLQTGPSTTTCRHHAAWLC